MTIQKSGTSESVSSLDASKSLSVPHYSADSNAPAGTLYRNTSDNQLKYKDGNGNVHVTSFVNADKQTSPSDNVPITSLADTDYVDIPFRVPSGKTLYVWMWGARTASQTTPAGLTVGLYDFGAAAYVNSQNTAHATGAPVASISGTADVALRLENATGGSVNAGATFAVTVE